eukprot:190156_1
MSIFTMHWRNPVCILVYLLFIILPLYHIITLDNSSKPSVINSPFQTPIHESIFISILVGKTISFDDINGTIIDINLMSYVSYNETHYTLLHWILFIWQHKTYIKMKELLGTNHSINLIYAKNKLKLFFWQTYLTPSMISNKYDYIWLMDGDIRISDMDWNCFWYNMHFIYKPKIFQPSILYANDYIPTLKEKVYRSTLYMGRRLCLQNNSYDTRTNSVNELFAIETSFVEQQTPIFTYDAWNIFITEFNNKFTNINESKSDWGADLMWCNLINDKLLHNSHNINTQFQQKWDETACGSDIVYDYMDYDAITKPYNITCMIVHGIPVKHMDSRTYPEHNPRNTRVFKNKRNRINRAQYMHIKRLFRKYFTTNHDIYHRAFKIKPSNNVQCKLF